MGTHNAVEFKLDITTLTNPKVRKHLFTGMSISNVFLHVIYTYREVLHQYQIKHL